MPAGTSRAADPPERVELGVAYSPQQRFVFPDSTIEKNLPMGRYVRGGGADADERRREVLELFPCWANDCTCAPGR